MVGGVNAKGLKPRSRSKPERRRWEKELRRRRRKAADGPARRHWDRRRRGAANSAPELRRRPSVDGVEDHLIGGRPRVAGAPPDREKRLRRMFRGIQVRTIDERYDAMERARQIELEASR